jgi:hypothetical protein
MFTNARSTALVLAAATFTLTALDDAQATALLFSPVGVARMTSYSHFTAGIKHVPPLRMASPRAPNRHVRTRACVVFIAGIDEGARNFAPGPPSDKATQCLCVLSLATAILGLRTDLRWS